MSHLKRGLYIHCQKRRCIYRINTVILTVHDDILSVAYCLAESRISAGARFRAGQRRLDCKNSLRSRCGIEIKRREDDKNARQQGRASAKEFFAMRNRRKYSSDTAKSFYCGNRYWPTGRPGELSTPRFEYDSASPWGESENIIQFWEECGREGEHVTGENS